MPAKLKQYLGLNPQKILCGLENSDDLVRFVSTKHYREIWLPPSRSGKKARKIALPSDQLLRIQRRINSVLLLPIRPHKAATAYYPGSSIIINSATHLQCRDLYKTDISDFIGSIKSNFILENLNERPFTRNPAMLRELLPLVTRGSSLPVGAATSAHLSNIVLKRFDRKLFDYAVKSDAVYTRYGDDISISSTKSLNFDKIDSFVVDALQSCGFKQNRSKTKLLGEFSPKTVTGISITDGFLRPTLRFRKSCTAAIRVCERYPIRYTVSNATRIDGYLNFWRSVCPSDPALVLLEQRVRQLTRPN